MCEHRRSLPPNIILAVPDWHRPCTGYGAFHRAHQAVYIDDYMARTGDLGWGIAAVNLRLSESASFADAAQNKNGYLLKYTGTSSPTAYRMVRPHIRFADWSQDAADAEGLMALDTVHAVSITVTESGYYLDDAGNLNLQILSSVLKWMAVQRNPSMPIWLRDLKATRRWRHL